MQKYRHTKRQTDIQGERQTGTGRQAQPDRQTYRHHTDINTGRHTDTATEHRRTHNQKTIQRYRQTYIQTWAHK